MRRAAAAVLNARRFSPRPAKVDEVKVYRKERGWGKNLSRAQASQLEARKARQHAEWARRRAKQFAGLQRIPYSPNATWVLWMRVSPIFMFCKCLICRIGDRHVSSFLNIHVVYKRR